MNLTNTHNPVFDFTVAGLPNGEYDFSLKYRGKEIDITESEYTDDSFATSLNQSPDEFLDFETEYFMYFPSLRSRDSETFEDVN